MTPTRVDITAAPRAVLRESVRLLYRVLGEERLSTARANAWEAVCDDRRRAEEREHVARLLAAARTRTHRDSRDHDLRVMITRRS